MSRYLTNLQKFPQNLIQALYGKADDIEVGTVYAGNPDVADPFLDLMQRKLPKSWIDRLQTDRGNSTRQTAAEINAWKDLLTAWFTRVLLYGVIILAIYIGSRLYFVPLVNKLLPSVPEIWRKVISAGVTLAAMTPFIFGLGVQSGSIGRTAPRLIREKPGNIWPIMGLVFARSFLAVGIILGVLSTFFDLAGWTILVIIIAGIAFIFLARKSIHKYSGIEARFLRNYNEREENERRAKPVTSSVQQKLSNYDVRTEAFTIASESSLTGQKLRDLPLRDKSGANIIKIQRGSKSIVIPSADVPLYPGDRLLAVGTTEQLEKLRNLITDSVDDSQPESDEDGFGIEPQILTADSFLTGKTLRGAALRKYQCMVISVLREGHFITNPEPDLVFQEGDTVWIAGNISNIEADWASDN